MRAAATIDEVLARQWGVIDRAQALAGGLSERQIDYRLARGSLVRIHASVYRHPAFPSTYEQRLAAALRAAGPGAAVSHRAAVAVWGLHGYGASTVELSRPRASRRQPRGAIVHHAADLRRRHVRHHRGIAVTNPARTLVDLGAVAPALVERCLEAWLADRVVGIDAVAAALDEHTRRGRQGPACLRHVLEHRVLGDAIADSAVEAALPRILKDRGVPMPIHHHIVRDRSGRVIAELDFAYPGEQIGIEIDGYGVHLRSRTTFESDRIRQNELEIAGWRVMRFAAAQVLRDPDRVADQILRMLKERWAALRNAGP